MCAQPLAGRQGRLTLQTLCCASNLHAPPLSHVVLLPCHQQQPPSAITMLWGGDAPHPPNACHVISPTSFTLAPCPLATRMPRTASLVAWLHPPKTTLLPVILMPAHSSNPTPSCPCTSQTP